METEVIGTGQSFDIHATGRFEYVGKFLKVPESWLGVDLFFDGKYVVAECIGIDPKHCS